MPVAAFATMFHSFRERRSGRPYQAPIKPVRRAPPRSKVRKRPDQVRTTKSIIQSSAHRVVSTVGHWTLDTASGTKQACPVAGPGYIDLLSRMWERIMLRSLTNLTTSQDLDHKLGRVLPLDRAYNRISGSSASMMLPPIKETSSRHQ